MIDIYMEVQRASLIRFEYFNQIHLYINKTSDNTKNVAIFNLDKIKEFLSKEGVSKTEYGANYGIDTLGDHYVIRVSVLYNISDVLNELIAAFKEHNLVYQKLDQKK